MLLKNSGTDASHVLNIIITMRYRIEEDSSLLCTLFRHHKKHLDYCLVNVVFRFPRYVRMRTGEMRGIEAETMR